jgi:alanyl-tRNA synthetase
VWVGVAFPTDLDAALTELKAAYPALAENVERLRQVAEAEATHYEAEPAATPELFTAALASWERATMDGLQALSYVQLAASPGHQLDLPQLRKLDVSHV